MAKIVGAGETIVDLIFKNGEPQKAVPGGSVFNALVSAKHAGADVLFVSETGKDKVGRIVLDFLKENGISTDYIYLYDEVNTPVSMAFLNDKNDAEYVFYKPRPQSLPVEPLPVLSDGDALLFGSFYSLSADTRSRLVPLLSQSAKVDCVRYYDPNFRSSHLKDLDRLLPVILDNMRSADIVRGSDEDFRNIFGSDEFAGLSGEDFVRALYERRIGALCGNFICTCGSQGVWLCTQGRVKFYPSRDITTVSTIGAGDSFNAGVLSA
ncbi:MAG: carbohydrate kinase, partial [Paludibacteraceae bacterium]|nr:carbohydrate kinase [Paludibacteraceae bacterium]